MRSPTSSIKKIAAELLRRGPRVPICSFPGVYSIWNRKNRPKKGLLLQWKLSVHSLLITINNERTSNGKSVFYPTNRPSNNLWFQSATSVDHQENVLMTDTPFQPWKTLQDKWLKRSMSKHGVAVLSFLPTGSTISG